MTKANYSACAPLCGCGNPITKFFKSGKPGKFCQSCRDRQAGKHRSITNEHAASCAHCKTHFESIRKKLYCSLQRSRKAQDKKRSPVSRAEYDAMRRSAANYFKCEHCGKDSYRKMSGTNKGPNRFCTMQCKKDAAAAIRPAPYSPCYGLHCKECSKPFVSKTNKLRCSRACELALFRRMALSYARTKHKEAARVVACEQCECQFSPLYGYGNSTLCTPCAEQRTKVARKIAKMQRKALMRGVEAERVDPMRVFARDKWRCKLCGIATPKHKRGTYDDDAPELDHIVPISKGGPHTYLNTQCACRKCNNIKSDRPMGQMLLIG